MKCGCSNGCCHHTGDSPLENQGNNYKSDIIKVLVSLIALFLAFFIFKDGLLYYITVTVGYFAVGTDILIKSFRNILKGKFFDEYFLLTVASIGAVILGDYKEAVAIAAFFTVGELFEEIATERSRKSIRALARLRPESAEVLVNNEYIIKSPSEVLVGELIRVTPGMRIPLDGCVFKGNANLDCSALTGEAMPVPVTVGSHVKSGSVVNDSVLEIKVTSLFSESTVNRIIRLAENEEEKKSKPVAFITRFAKVYTPTVILLAAAVALLMPLVVEQVTFKDSLYRALSFLVISCPCALIVSVPLSFFAGIGRASACGVMLKGGTVIESLSALRTIAFDKTGTVTDGSFSVLDVTSESTLMYAAYAESYSTHPIGRSIVNAYNGVIDKSRVSNYRELAGLGVFMLLDGKKLLCGNASLLKQNGIDVTEKGSIFIAYDGEYMGRITLGDRIKPEARGAVSELERLGIRKTVLLSGDSALAVEAVSKALGTNVYQAELMPSDKVEALKEIKKDGVCAFVGDGINDAPVLVSADVGIAMGGLGSEAAMDAADAVIMSDSLAKIPYIIRLSRYVMLVSKTNITFIIAIKLACLVLSACGVTTIWTAVFADVGVLVLSVLNSLTVFLKRD